jgi:hypothetical protein
MEEPSPTPQPMPFKAYKFKEDYSFDNDIYGIGRENTASWDAKKDDIALGNPPTQEQNENGVLNGMIGLMGKYSGWVESSALEEVSITDQILRENNIIDQRFVGDYGKRPSWLKRKWNSIQEWRYYIFKAKFVVVRSKVKYYDAPKPLSTGSHTTIAGELQEEMYFSSQKDEQGKYKTVWSTSTKDLLVFRFFPAMMLIFAFRRQNKNNPEYQFSLVTIEDVQFINSVMGERPSE